MKLPWQQPPGLVEGCSSVSVGWLADMLADGPYQLLGRRRQGPSPAAFKPAPRSRSEKPSSSLLSRRHRRQGVVAHAYQSLHLGGCDEMRSAWLHRDPLSKTTKQASKQGKSKMLYFIVLGRILTMCPSWTTGIGWYNTHEKEACFPSREKPRWS